MEFNVFEELINGMISGDLYAELRNSECHISCLGLCDRRDGAETY